MIENKLYSPRVMKDVLDRHGFRFTKSLGQNFLIDGNIINKIADAAGIDSTSGVIEIGPGFGTLTQVLCERSLKVVAIEIDKSLKAVHDETLNYDNLKIIYDDFMRLAVNSIIDEYFDGMDVRIVANLPYYITTPIIMKVLEERLNISRMVVMVQKEVARRLAAGPGTKDYGAISLSVRYRSDVHIAMTVPGTVFMPRPKVDSAVVVFDLLDKPRVSVRDEDLMFAVIKSAFGQRRKTLLNSLSSSLKLDKDDVKRAVTLSGVDPSVRGEVLSIEEFASIADNLYDVLNS